MRTRSIESADEVADLRWQGAAETVAVAKARTKRFSWLTGRGTSDRFLCSAREIIYEWAANGQTCECYLPAATNQSACVVRPTARPDSTLTLIDRTGCHSEL